MAEVGTGGQTNITQSNSTGNQGIDISNIGNITDDMSLEDISGLYTDLGSQYNDIAVKAAEDVGRRQQELIGNDFGAVNPYNYNQYYQPGSNEFQSQMRVQGTQTALSIGMDRAKKEAEAKAAAAKNDYSNAQSALENLEKARKNAKVVSTGNIGGNTSAQELLSYAQAANAGSADELYRDVSAKYLSDDLVEGNWNIKNYREAATAATLAKFGISQEQYNNFSEDERSKFWARGDVGAFWTNQYANRYAKEMYGDQVAADYQKAYEYNYNIVKELFSAIKNHSESIQCITDFMVVKKESTDAWSSDSADVKISAGMIVRGSNTFNFHELDDEKRGYKISESEKSASIYNYVSEEDGNKIRELRKKYNEYDQGLVFDQKKFDEHQEVKKQLENAIAEGLSHSESAAKKKSSNQKITFVKDTENAERFVEDAFGADFESISYLNNMRINNPQQFEDLVHDYSLVLTYGQVFEIADGEKVYHTAEGDKKLEKGTYVMYTLPGFQDANGEFIEPNLKRYMELRGKQFSADIDDKNLQEEMQKSLEGYQKVVSAALFLAAGADCDTNESIVHAAIYASNPSSNDTKNGTVYGGHTTKEIIEKFAELSDKEPEKAYTLFTKIIKKAASVSGSMMSNYGGQLTTVSTMDDAGRDMVGSEINGEKKANTLFSEGDIDNLTVEEATALWTVIGTSVDQYNNGTQNGNIKPDFLTADGLNWFQKFGIEFIKGTVGIIDLVGNLVWTGLSATATQIGTLIEGRGGQWTEEEYDRVFKNGRWWGWGGITGNWTGQASFYDQFIGDYKPTAFGYGEENQNRMTDNLNHLVTPIMEDMWFGENNTTQKAMGVGRAGDEGITARSVMNFTASMAGLVASVVAGNYIAKGIGAFSNWGAEKISKAAAKVMASNAKTKFTRAAFERASAIADTMLTKAATVSGEVSSGPADDVARIVSKYTDDVANQSDDAAKEVVGMAKYGKEAPEKNPGMNLKGGTQRTTAGNIGNAASDYNIHVAEGVEAGMVPAGSAQATMMFSGVYDDTINALGYLASASPSELVVDDVVKYSEKLFRELTGLKKTDETYKAIISQFTRGITKQALSLAHLSAYSGMSIDQLSNLGAESLTILSNMAAVQSGAISANLPGDLARYLGSMSKETLVDTLQEISERAAQRAAAKGTWTMDDTIRTLARNGWDSKRLTLMTKDWLKNQLQDVSTDVLYGYIKPTVTNEGTDRETIDEYFANPLNYVMNAGAAGIQYIGGRLANKVGQTVTANRLDKARAALVAAEAAEDSAQIQKKAAKVMKLVDKANTLADKALERGKSLEDVRELTNEANSYADEAMDAMTKDLIRNKSDADFAKFVNDAPGLAQLMSDEDLGITKNLFYAYNSGIVKGNANYYHFKRMLNTYNNGLGNVVDVPTNGKIWTALIEGRHDILREMNIARGDVTVAQQKKIYKAMVDRVMDLDIAKTIPGLRNSLNSYFDTLVKLAEDGGYSSMRAGYLPIESMLNNNKDVSAGIRGFSNGSWVLDSDTANPWLERSEALKDSDIVKAILNGDKEIKLKDADGNFIVDADGNIQTRELNPEGLNFLDSITNASNAHTFHKFIDPIVGRNGQYAGLQAGKNGYVIVKQKGAMEAALDKSLARDKAVIERIEKTAFSTENDKRLQSAIRKQAKIKVEKALKENPRIEKAMAMNETVQSVGKKRLDELNTQKTTITKNQQEFPARIMGFVNDAGHIDTKAGFKVFRDSQALVKSDIKKFQNGEITVGGFIDTPFQRYDKFAWQYKRDTDFGAVVPGYSQKVVVDAQYYKLLEQCAKYNITEPPKDMTMRRMLMTQATAPTDAKGNIWKSVSNKGVEYKWTSPLQYYRSANVTDSAVSNIELRNFQGRTLEGWTYKPAKGRAWDAAKFDSLVLDSPANIRVAKDIIMQNVPGLASSGTGSTTAKKMLDEATQQYLTQIKSKVSSSNGVHLSPTFSDYVENMSIMLAEDSVFRGAFTKDSGYNGLFTVLNSYENTGGTFKEFGDYLASRIRTVHDEGGDISNLALAMATWEEIRGHNHRAIGLGENFDTELRNSDRSGFLMDSSREAVAANQAGYGVDPAKGVLRREAEANKNAALEYFSGRAGENFSDIVAAMDAVGSTPENLKQGLSALYTELDAFVKGDEYLTRYNARIDMLAELGGGTDSNGVKHQGIIEKTNDLIKRASKENGTIKKRIEEYTSNRIHRQDAYGVAYNKGETKYDALKAFGATPINEGYSLTKNPTQYRAAKRNLDLYKQNARELDILKADFEDAVKEYKMALAEYNQQVGSFDYGIEKDLYNDKTISTEQSKIDALNKKVLEAQGRVDETRKRFSRTMDEMGIDLSSAYEHDADWSGYAIDYDRMMVNGGAMEGKIDQSISALEEVKSIIISSNDPNSSSFLNEIEATIDGLKTARDKVPEYERLNYKDIKGSSEFDSIEMSLAFTMADTIYGEGVEQSSRYVYNPKNNTYTIVETKPSNHLFTDAQLNSIAPTSKVYDAAYANGQMPRHPGINTRQRQLDYDIDSGYSNKMPAGYDPGSTTFEFEGDKNSYIELRGVGVDDPEQKIGIDFMHNGEWADISEYTPEQIAELNAKAFENKGSNLRIGIVEDVESASHPNYEFSYGDKQPEFEKLRNAKTKADDVLGYFDLDKNDSARIEKYLKDHKLTKKDVSISRDDAVTDAWIADKELRNFENANTDAAASATYTPELAEEAKLKAQQRDNKEITVEQYDEWVRQNRNKTAAVSEDIDAKIERLKAREAKLVEDVKTAREFGDLSENEEYRSAKNDLRQVRSEIRDLEDMKSGKKQVPVEDKYTEAEKELIIHPDQIKSVGESYGKYTIVELADSEYYDVNDTDIDIVPDENRSIDYNRDAAYTEWLAYSKDEDAIQKKIDDMSKKTKSAMKKSEKAADAEKKAKIKDPDDSSKTTSYENLSEDAFEKELKKRLSEKDYNDWKSAREHLEYSRKIKESLKNKKNVDVYRDHNGFIYLNEKNQNIAGYATYQHQLEGRGWKPLKKGDDVPPVDEKLDKKNRKAMNKAITHNRHAGDIMQGRLEDWKMPTDKKGNTIFDAASKNATIANMENIYGQIRKATGLDISREGLLMNNEYADLMTRITDESTTAGKFRNAVTTVSNFAQSIQNVQLAGGMSFVNALSIAQLRGAVLQDPRLAKEYVKVIGSMRNSHAVAMFAQDNLPLLSKFVLETGDSSILNDFGAAISTRPGVSDGGVLQNVVNNTMNLRKDWVDQRVRQNKSIPKSLVGIISKDVQDTIFEDATFKNAIPVLRAKMLTANYDAAINKLKHKFPNMDGKIMERAAIQMAYGKTEAFFNPYRVVGKKKLSDVLDNTFTREVRDFAATFTNSKSQATVLDTLTNFFFALRYKLMLSGRVYDAVGSAIPTAVNKVKGITAKEATDEALDAIGTSFMHSGSLMGVGSLGACAVIAATQAAALGIPTAWDDVSWIDEYDGSFKIPDVLLKFQTIGQIWLPNAYSQEKGLYVDPTNPMYGLDTMSSIFTLQNSFFRTIDRTVNPETYYAAPQRGIIGSASSEDAINKFLNASFPRAIGDELIGSNLLSPFKAVYEVIMDSTYFGNNIWEKRKLPNGKDNPNYDFGRNIAASTMHILGLDQVLDGGKGYNGWVKGQGTSKYVEQDQIGTVKGSGILQHEFLTAAIEMMEGKYIEAIYEAGELPIKAQNLSSKARTEFNTRIKNLVAGYNDEYKAVTSNVDSTNDDKDAAFKLYAQRAADAVATWSKKHNYALGQDQKLVPYVTRTLMAMLSGEYDDDMFYVQDAYWKASVEAQIEGVTSNNYWLDDEDLKQWIAEGKSAEDFAKEKNKRAQAYNKAQDDEYEARKALIEAGYPEEYLTKYSYNDLKAEQRAVNKEIYASIHSKLDMPVGEFDNYKEMKKYYETLIENTTSKKQKVNLAMTYNTYVFDLLAPYAEKYGANIVNDAYYNGKGLANDLSDYVILPADKNYKGKNPISNYIKDVFNVGYRNGGALPSDSEVVEKFITAQNLMMKGAVSSSVSVLDNIIEAIKKGQVYASDYDYGRIINMRAILSARSK